VKTPEQIAASIAREYPQLDNSGWERVYSAALKAIEVYRASERPSVRDEADG
jgi:hypothetical protein